MGVYEENIVSVKISVMRRSLRRIVPEDPSLKLLSRIYSLAARRCWGFEKRVNSAIFVCLLGKLINFRLKYE